MTGTIILIAGIIGRIILCVIILILILLAVLLLVPLKYSIEGEKNGKIKALIDVSWLLKLVHAVIKINTAASGKNKIRIRLKLFGKMVYEKPRRRKHRKTSVDTKTSETDKPSANTETSADAKPSVNTETSADAKLLSAEKKPEAEKVTIYSISEKNIGCPESAENVKPTSSRIDYPVERAVSKSGIDVSIENEETGNNETKQDSGRSGISGMIDSVSEKLDRLIDRLGDFIEKLDNIPDKLDDFADKIDVVPEKIDAASEKLEELGSKKDKALAIYDEHKEWVWKTLFRIEKLILSVMPEIDSLKLHFGFRDCAKTGKTMGYLSLLYAVCPDALDLWPDFDNEIMEGSIKLHGSFRLIRLVTCLLPSILCRDFFKLIKQIKHFSSQ